MQKHNITTKLNWKQNTIVYIMQFYGNELKMKKSSLG